MKLEAQQIALLLKTMEQSFNPLELQRLLLERFRLQMHNVTALYKPFDAQVLDVHAYFDHRNTAEELVAALRDARPRVSEFAMLSDAMGFTVVPASAQFEVLVRREGSPYADVAAFRAQLSAIENAVCRVETPGGYGTGVLVAPDLVLTNHHVVGPQLQGDGSLAGTTTCLFDHKKSAGGYTSPARRVMVTRARAWSPPAPEDLQPHSANTDPQKLDYALLHLAEKVGNEPIVPGGDKRGWIHVDGGLPVTAQGEVVIVVQHPLAQTMKIGLGAVTTTMATRIRHDANTEKGSSGAPVFDRNLKLVALHHVGVDWPDGEPPFNQAVPVGLIAQHAGGQNVVL